MGKRYQVMRDCHGFKGKFWHRDEIVTLEDDEVPPRHFLSLDGSTQTKKVLEDVAEEKTALSQIQQKSIKPQPTAAKVFKGQKKSTGAGEDF